MANTPPASASSTPYVETPAFGPLDDINIKAFDRGSFSYNQVKATAGGSNEVGTGTSGTSIDGGGGGGTDCCFEVFSAIEQIYGQIENLGLAISDLQSRIEAAEIVAECDGTNINIELLL